MLAKGIYKHFKGNLYRVIHIARHSETEEEYVVYHNADTPESIWIRPLGMFMEKVERNGVMVKRFEWVREG